MEDDWIHVDLDFHTLGRALDQSEQEIEGDGDDEYD